MVEQASIYSPLTESISDSNSSSTRPDSSRLAAHTSQNLPAFLTYLIRSSLVGFLAQSLPEQIGAISGREERRLLNFLRERIGDDYIEIFQGSIKRSDKTIGFSFGQTFEKEEVYGSFHITINDSKNRADLTIYDEVNGDVSEMDLLVKETPGDGDFRIYVKRNDRTKK